MGATLEPYDFDEAKTTLEARWKRPITDEEVLAHALYPQVFEEWQLHKEVYGPVGKLPTRQFLVPMEVGDEVLFELAPGNIGHAVMLGSTPTDAKGQRRVLFELNGEPRTA